MAKKIAKLAEKIEQDFSTLILFKEIAYDELTIECNVIHLRDILQQLKTNDAYAFDQLIDVCGVDYLYYGVGEWETEPATERGFSRAVEADYPALGLASHRRFAVVYHLLSTVCNHRIRVKVFLDADCLVVPSVHDIWKAADWFEREAYDLYGILFEHHPDLRRILTDYGFIGYPFRKDFPLSGHVEMRYDATLQRVIYEPVDIVPRVLVPKVIRDDNRYIDNQVLNDDRT